MPRRDPKDEPHLARPMGLHNGEAADMGRDRKAKGRHGTDGAILPTGGVVTAFDATSSRLLQSGRVMELRMPLRDAERMKAMVDL